MTLHFLALGFLPYKEVVAYRELGDNTKLIGRAGPSLVGFEACIISGTFFRRAEFFF